MVTPVDPDTRRAQRRALPAGAEALGASNGPIARNAGPVVCCGTCPSGCEIDAKQAMHVVGAAAPPPQPAASCGRGQGQAGDRRAGRAVGVSCDTQAGAYEVRARAVVLAAGASARPSCCCRRGSQLVRAGRPWPQIHPACWVGARLRAGRARLGRRDAELVRRRVERTRVCSSRRPSRRSRSALTGFPERGRASSERHRRLRRARGDRRASVGAHSAGRVRVGRAAHAHPYRLGEDDAEAIRFGIARAAESTSPPARWRSIRRWPGCPSARARAGTRRSRASAFARRPAARGLPPDGNRRAWARTRSSMRRVAHRRGARLSSALHSGRLDLPDSLRVNPMITIMACARRIAAGIAERSR